MNSRRNSYSSGYSGRVVEAVGFGGSRNVDEFSGCSRLAQRLWKISTNSPRMEFKEMETCSE